MTDVEQLLKRQAECTEASGPDMAGKDPDGGTHPRERPAIARLASPDRTRAAGDTMIDTYLK